MRAVGQYEARNLEAAELLLRKLLAARGQAATTAVPPAHSMSWPGEPPSDNGDAMVLAIMCGDARWQLPDGADRGFLAARRVSGNCADDTVTRYLVHGALPAQDVTCQSSSGGA